MMTRDPVANTIATYEKTSEHYYNNSDNLVSVKDLLDYFIANVPGKKVLEIGCGPGRDAKYLSEHGLDVIGIDLTQHFVAMATKNAPKATIRKMDMRALDFPDASFDGLWVMASFLHIPKRQAQKTLAGFHRVLAPGGLMYISVKVGEGEKTVIKKRYGGGSKFFALYEPEELKKLLTDNGFKIVKIDLAQNRFSDPFINVFAKKI